MKLLVCDRCRELVDEDNPVIGRPYSVTKYRPSGRQARMDLCRSCQNGLKAWWDRGKTKNKTDEEN